MSLASQEMDKVIVELGLTKDMGRKKEIAKGILKAAREKGIYPASINAFYMARGRGEFGRFTVPAVNLRGMTYDLARALFRVAKARNAGAFIFEIARSEIVYTDQSPTEYAALCLAAAVREGFSGPVFIQGDHFQAKTAKYKEDPGKEIGAIKSLIKEAIEAGFYNIDIDSSTLVDLSKSTLAEQQRINYEVCAELTKFIRQVQPEGVEVSVGGEIGEIGGKNSNPEELRAFISGYNQTLPDKCTGISKISVQTGTVHGGMVLPDGTIAKVNLDFDTLKTLSSLAKEEFGLAGAVQHGASTLPNEMFYKFPEIETAEIHLATQYQNMIYESRSFPLQLRDKIYDWLRKELASEKKEGQQDAQFIYKTRKKAFGPFKKDLLGLDEGVRGAIAKEIEEEFDFLFDKLNVANTKDLISKYYPKK